MNLQSYVNVARKQFYGMDKQAAKRVLEKYAWEELELTGEELSAFVKNATYKQLDIMVINGLNKFFVWFYLNYAGADNWDVKIYHPPINEVFDVCIHPINKYEENGEILFKKCDREAANLWSVYIRTNEGDNCVADCKSELVATRLKELLLMILRNWKVRILVDSDLEKIFTSHTLEVLVITRSMVIKEPRTRKVDNAFEIAENSRIGEFYKCISVATEDDLLIRNLIKSAGF